MLMIQRSHMYEGAEYSTAVGGTRDVFRQTFIGCVLQDRDGRKRDGLPMPTWGAA